MDATRFSLTPMKASEVPDVSGEGRYPTLIRQFLESGAEAARIDGPIPEDRRARQCFILGFRNAIKRAQSPCRLAERRGEVYLLRTEEPKP